jgi:hypothetical protein
MVMSLHIPCQFGEKLHLFTEIPALGGKQPGYQVLVRRNGAVRPAIVQVLEHTASAYVQKLMKEKLLWALLARKDPSFYLQMI